MCEHKKQSQRDFIEKFYETVDIVQRINNLGDFIVNYGITHHISEDDLMNETEKEQLMENTNYVEY